MSKTEAVSTGSSERDPTKGWSFKDVDEFIKEMGGYEQLQAASDSAKTALFSNPVETERRYNRLHKAFIEEPLFRRYIDHIKNGAPSNTQAWQAQGERLYAAFSALVTPEMTITLEGANDGMEDANPAMGETVEVDMPLRFTNTLRILCSHVYLWTDEIRNMANSMPLPRHIISRELLPYPSMFWSFETSLIIMDPKTEKTLGSVDWLFLCEERDPTTGEPNELSLISNFNRFIRDDNGDPVAKEDSTMLYGTIPYGAVYPDELGREQHLILALLAFLHTPLLQVTKTRLPRPIRREMKRFSARNKQTIGDVETNVVTLRRPQSEKSDDPSFGIIYRDHRWWVSGHFRAQWYPSAKGHKLIWIAPHLKGPENKPIKEKTYHVKR